MQRSIGSSAVRYMCISYFIRCFPHFPNGSVALYDCTEMRFFFLVVSNLYNSLIRGSAFKLTTMTQNIQISQVYVFNLPYTQVRSLADVSATYNPYSAVTCKSKYASVYCHTICFHIARFAFCSVDLWSLCRSVLSMVYN